MIGVSILQSTEEHMYSVVDKSKKKKKSTETPMYSVVDKSKKKKKSTEIPMYSVVDKSKKKKKTSSPVCSYTIYVCVMILCMSCHTCMLSTHVTMSALKCVHICIHVKNMCTYA